jgi:hypothetical protein
MTTTAKIADKIKELKAQIELLESLQEQVPFETHENSIPRQVNGHRFGCACYHCQPYVVI